MTDSTLKTKFDRPAYLVRSKSLRDLLADLRKAELWLMMAAIAAFLASAFFVVKYFVGGEMTPEVWSTEQWMNALLGLGITAVITAAQAFLYASGYKGHAAIIATFVVVFFGLFSEISQSMEREDATVRHRSENSAVFQAAIGSIQTIANSNTAASYASQIARAEQILARCKENLRLGRERHCNGDQAAVDALKAQQAAAVDAKTNLLGSAVAQAKALEYDEDKHYAMIRLIRNFLGVTGIWASFLFSVIIIGTFEYAFHFVGAYVADHKSALLLLGRDAQGDLINPASNIPKGADPADKGVIPEDHANKLRNEYLDWVSPERAAAVAGGGRAPAPVVDSAAEPVQSGETVSDLSQKRFFKLIYTEVRNKILNGEIKPTVRPVTDMVTDIIKRKASLLGLKPSMMGKPQRQQIAEQILQTLEKETVVMLNQEGGVGKAKYVLAPRYAEAMELNRLAS